MFAGNYRAFKYEGCHVYVTKQFFLLQDRSTSIPEPFPGLGLFPPRRALKTGKRPWERGWIEVWERPFISETLKMFRKGDGERWNVVFICNRLLARWIRWKTGPWLFREHWAKWTSRFLMNISLVIFPASVRFCKFTTKWKQISLKEGQSFWKYYNKAC